MAQDIQEDKQKENNTGPLFALVTGASRGLGKAFATELAKQNINLLLVALPGDGLPELCGSLKKEYNIKCDYFETDLTEKNSIADLVKWALSGFRINILINNAGMGGSREFVTAETEYLENMIALNIRALTLITHQLLPELKSHKKAWILNVSSIASFSPIGYKTIYSASKVFVQYFTRGLYQELKDTGVFASVVHPGPMATNYQVAERIDSHGVFGKMGLLSPEYVARRSIKLLFKNKSLIIPGWFNRMCWFVMKTVPIRIRLPIISKRFKKELTDSKQ